MGVCQEGNVTAEGGEGAEGGKGICELGMVNGEMEGLSESGFAGLGDFQDWEGSEGVRSGTGSSRRVRAWSRGPGPRFPYRGTGRALRLELLWTTVASVGSWRRWPKARRGRVTNQLFQLIAILATAKRPKDRLSRAVFVLIRVAQARSCWQMARYMRALMSLEGGHSGRTWANQLRNTPFRRISWSRWGYKPAPTGAVGRPAGE